MNRGKCLCVDVLAENPTLASAVSKAIFPVSFLFVVTVVVVRFRPLSVIARAHTIILCMLYGMCRENQSGIHITSYIHHPYTNDDYSVLRRKKKRRVLLVLC